MGLKANIDGVDYILLPEDEVKFLPVVNPSSGNIQGQGMSGEHQVVYTDANNYFNADAMGLISTDPSALVQVPVTGTVTTGDVITLNFHFNSLTKSVTYTCQSGDTTTSIATGLKAAIKANADLYQQVSAENTSGGGLPGQILFAISTGNVLQLDYDVRETMTMTYSVSGSATEILTIPNPLPTLLDANPVFSIGRNTGVAPASGSNIGQWVFVGTQSASPGAISVQYATLACTVLDSTSGQLKGKIVLGTCNPVSGSIDRGLGISQGIWVLGAVGSDKGVGTINAKEYYKDGVLLSTGSGNVPSGGATGQVLKKASATDYDTVWDDDDVGTGGGSPAGKGFSARASATTLPPGFTKVAFSVEDFDPSNEFDATTNYRYTPQTAGKYQVNALVQIIHSNANKVTAVAIYKNGSRIKQQGHVTGNATSTTRGGSWLIDMNGTTDYLEVFAYHNDSVNGSIDTNAYSSHFSAYLTGV